MCKFCALYGIAGQARAGVGGTANGVDIYPVRLRNVAKNLLPGVFAGQGRRSGRVGNLFVDFGFGA